MINFRYAINIDETWKRFQGTDVSQGLSDAEALLRVCAEYPDDLGLEWENLKERIDAAIETVTKLEYEIAESRRVYLMGKARALAGRDAGIVNKACAEYANAARNLTDKEQSMFLLFGNPSETVLPWWTNLPGGSLVFDWQDDVGGELVESYEMALYDAIPASMPGDGVGSITVEDNCCWVQIRERDFQAVAACEGGEHGS